MLTALVTLIVAVVPGAALAFAFPPGRSRWLVWASSPVLTLGLISLGLAWLTAVGLPSGAGAILVLELVVVLAAIATARLLDRRHAATTIPDQSASPVLAARGGRHWWTGFRRRSKLPARFDLIAVLVPCAITVLFAELIMSGFRYPPGWDAQNHGFLTRNILRTGSTRMDAVCIDGTTHAHVTCHFYPLAMDVSWAQVVSLIGGPVSGAMMIWCLFLAPLTIVVALYAVVRASGGGAVVAGCAAAAPALLGPMWATQAVGRIPEVVAPALAVAVAMMFAAAVRGTHPIRMGALAGLGMAGVLIAHTYDVLFAAMLAVALVLSAGVRLQVRAALRATVAAVATAVLTIVPFLGVLAGAGSERTQADPPYVGNLGGAWHYWVADLRTYSLFGYPTAGNKASQLGFLAVQIGLWVTVPCLLLSPLCLFIARLRWARPWVAMWVLWIAVGLWTTTSNSGPAASLAGLWYGVRGRLQTLMLPTLPLLAVAGACVIGTGLQWCVHARARRATARPAVARPAGAWMAAVPVALILVLAVLGLGNQPRAPLHAALSARTPRGASYPRMFGWLAQHVPAGDVYATDRNRDFASWAYADHGTGVLFGISPLVAKSRKDGSERLRAWFWLVNAPDAPDAGCQVRKYHVAYVLIGSEHVPDFAGQYYPKQVARSPRLRLAHTDGPLRAYRVTAAARTCAGSK